MISMWADCGEKIKNVLWIARKLQDDIHITVKLNFFCPRHGHSECDAHFAHGKRVSSISFCPIETTHNACSQRLRIDNAGSSVSDTVSSLQAAFEKHVVFFF